MQDTTYPWLAYYDDGVPAALAFDDRTLVEFLTHSVTLYGDRPALIFMNRTLTYRELQDDVSRFAGALERLGIERGARVAVMAPNIPQFVIAYYGALSLGAVVVPTNPLYTAREIEHQWNDAGCEAAVVMDFAYAQRIEAIRDALPVKHYIVASIPEYLRFPLNVLAPLKLRRQDPPLIAKVAPSATVHAFRDLLAAARHLAPAHADLDDVATLLYTGGTTGLSKGAMLTHRNLSCNVQQIGTWMTGMEMGRETILAALPLFHSFGMTVVMNLAVRSGAAQVLLPNPRDIPAIIKSVMKHRITMFPAVPNHYNAINAYAATHRVDLSSIKVCNSGSAPLPVDTLETFERLTGSKISEGFGLTETSPVTHCNPLFTTRKVGSIGVPLPNTEARIVDIKTGTATLAANEVGELIVRGPQVMKGYWNGPDETAQMIRDGWLHTGDLARIDEDGFCFIEGRKKDMILCSGFNVYPDEIDRVLAGHPAVAEAGTIGIPDAKRGETVKSFVVVEEGEQVSEDDLIAYCRENLASYKVPQYFEFVPVLPKSSVLKVLRRELREREMKRIGR